MNIRTRIYLAAASAILVGIVVTAMLTGAFIAIRQGNTAALATLCGIGIAVNIAVMAITLFFVHFNIRSTARQIAEMAQAARLELKEAGIVTPTREEERGDKESVRDLDAVILSMSVALKKKNDRVFYLENKIKHMTEHANAQSCHFEETLKLCRGECAETEKDMHLIMELSHEGIVRLDLEDRITFANRNFLAMIGRKESDFLSRSLFDVLKFSFEGDPEPVDSPDRQCKLAIAIESGVRQRLKRMWIAGPGGREVPVCATVSPILKHGSRVGVALAFEDRTDEIENYRLVQALYENTAEGFIFFSADFVPVDCNPALVRLFGAASKQEVLERFVSFNPKVQATGTPSEKATQEILERVGDVGQQTSFEWLHVSASEEQIPTLVTLSLVQVGKRKVYISNVRDLRPQKLAEQTAQTQNERSSRRVQRDLRGNRGKNTRPARGQRRFR